MAFAATALAAPPEDEIGFRTTAQNLFGHIGVRFLDHREPACRLTTAALGRCQMTNIRARPHGVLGERVARASHDIDSIKVVMQREGLTRFKQNGVSKAVGPGDLLCYDPTRSYALINTTVVHQVVFQVPREVFSSRALGRLDYPHLFERGIEGLPYIIGSLMAATAREIDALDHGARLRVGETLAALSAMLVGGEHDDRRDGEVAPIEILRRRVMAFINDNLGDPELSIDRVAAALRCSKRYIHRTFEGTGTTPERYLWEARLERCRHDLLATDKRKLTISESRILLRLQFQRAFFPSVPRPLRHEAARLPHALCLRRPRGAGAARTADVVSIPSLRAKRSNPESLPPTLGCFIAALLAMTSRCDPTQPLIPMARTSDSWGIPESPEV
jgi:AraC-like DNA-binding protein